MPDELEPDELADPELDEVVAAGEGLDELDDGDDEPPPHPATTIATRTANPATLADRWDELSLGFIGDLFHWLS